MAQVQAQRGAQRAVRTSGKYTVLSLVTTAHAMTHLYTALLPLTFPFVMQEFGITYTMIGAMMGVTRLIGAVFQFLFGYVNRYVSGKLLIGGGNLLLGLSTIWGGLATSFGQFSAARWAGDFAMSPQHPVGNSLIANQFDRDERGLALAINYSGANAGTLLVPIIASLLIANYGWRQALLVSSIPVLIVGTLVILLIREGPPVARAEAEEGAVRSPLQTAAALVAETRNLFKSRTTKLLTVALLIASAGRGIAIVLTFFPAYLSDKDSGMGLSTSLVGWLYASLLLGSILGPLVLGRISDRIGGRKSILLGIYIASTLLLVPLLSGGNLGLWTIGLVILLFGAVCFSEDSMMQAFFADVVPARSRDILFGTYFALSYAVSALWVMFHGWLIDQFGFKALFMAMGVGYLVAGALVAGTREEPVESVASSAPVRVDSSLDVGDLVDDLLGRI